MPTGNLHEHTFNIQLADVLRDTNARWREDDDMVRPERRRNGKQIDIEIADPGLRHVAIELAYGGDGDKDAKARLGGDIDTAIAVAIPPEFKAMSARAANAALRDGATVRYAVLQDRYRFPSRGYIEGTVGDLAAIIPVAAVTRERLAKLADEVAAHIDSARENLERVIPPELAKRLVANVYQRSTLTGLRTMLVLWLDAMLVQTHLNAAKHDTPELPLANEVRPSQLADAWRKILRTNWRSIFKPAVDALVNVSRKNLKETAAALRELLHAVEAIESSRLGDHINIAAELFPKLSEDRKNAAAFYTTPATAELTASLLIREVDDHQWGDMDIFRRMRVADMACGTGTLLRAAYHRVRGLHELHGGTTETVATMHKAAMERGITGCDVSAIAAHLATSSLAVMGGGTPYGSTQIGWVDVGNPRGKGCTTGSLELLAESSVDDLFIEMGGTAAGTDLGEGMIAVTDGSLDYAIMNPPYSRTRGGQSAFDIAGLNERQRKQCQTRWDHLLKRRARAVGSQDADRRAGMAASFVCLAESKLKPGGRIGVVLPVTAAASDSWKCTRAMIQRAFEDVLVVAKAGRSDGKEALSADTEMGEMLLVATKRKREARDGRTEVTAATLNNMPTRQGESGEYARAIAGAMQMLRGRTGSRPVEAGNDELGSITTCAYGRGGPWTAVGAANPDCINAALSIAAGEGLADDDGMMRFPIPFESIGDVLDPGPTHHLIGHPHGGDPCGAYEMHEIRNAAQTRGKGCALWKADAKAQTCMVTPPTHKGIPVDERLAKRLQQKRGRTHYSRGIQWTSQALLVATTQAPTFGGRAWLTVRHDDEAVLKAFVLWGNSTFGLVSHWTQATKTQKGRGMLQVNGIKATPCPKLDRLPPGVLAEAADTFEQLKDTPMLPACQSHADPVRHQIDDAVIAMMALPRRRGREAVARIRDLWCAEPSVHGDNRQALKLLRERGLA